MSGIVPKMAIRFTSYEWYKQLLVNQDGVVGSKGIFLGILASVFLVQGMRPLHLSQY